MPQNKHGRPRGRNRNPRRRLPEHVLREKERRRREAPAWARGMRTIAAERAQRERQPQLDDAVFPTTLGGPRP